MAAAHALARAGCSDVTIVERGPQARRSRGKLRARGALLSARLPPHPASRPHPALRARRDRRAAGDPLAAGPHALPPGREAPRPGSPLGFLRFPMSLADKARFARLMLRAFRKTTGRTGWAPAPPSWSTAGRVPGCAGDLRAAGEAALRALLPGDQRRLARHAAALPRGLGPARLPARRELDQTLCDGYQALLEKLGVGIRLGAPLVALDDVPAARSARPCSRAASGSPGRAS